MTDDDREGFEPEAAPDDAGDPAAAFEALRRTVEKQGGQIGAEMTVIRRGVEAASDQFEKYRQPPDYGPRSCSPFPIRPGGVKEKPSGDLRP